ncbi:MAG: 2-keto-4-pentenoate hydratase [Ramlibacter sp.]
MTPENLLQHYDNAQLWSAAPSDAEGFDVARAYQHALALRALRLARGEQPRGYKIGFTNRNIWPAYGVFAPIWGPVWDTTLSLCDGKGVVSLAGTCQPRLEPEAVFGLRAVPASDSLEALFDAIDWVAPGFEIVQSHLAGWKFRAADTVADGALHARLLVGARVPVRDIAADALGLEQALASAAVTLHRGEQQVDQGRGANVLDGPLHALSHFLRELRACPGAADLRAGDVVTTGTWTDAWPVEAGQVWQARFTSPLSRLEVRFN